MQFNSVFCLSIALYALYKCHTLKFVTKNYFKWCCLGNFHRLNKELFKTYRCVFTVISPVKLSLLKFKSDCFFKQEHFVFKIELLQTKILEQFKLPSIGLIISRGQNLHQPPSVFKFNMMWLSGMQTQQYWWTIHWLIWGFCDLSCTQIFLIIHSVYPLKCDWGKKLDLLIKLLLSEQY